MHLEFLIRRTVAAHVVLGADYPFDIGHYEPLGQFEGLRGRTTRAGSSSAVNGVAAAHIKD